MAGDKVLRREEQKRYGDTYRSPRQSYPRQPGEAGGPRLSCQSLGPNKARVTLAHKRS